MAPDGSPQQEQVWIGIGGNAGDVTSAIRGALAALATWSATPLRLSPPWRTAPWGVEDQPEFLNAVVGLSVQFPPLDLLSRLQRLEAEAGRVRTPENRWGPRPLDLDVLTFGARLSDDPRLTLPHPRLALRRFVLAPWADVAPEWVVPGLERTVAQLLADCPDGSWAQRSAWP